jgi:hypothetical protein
MAEHSKTPWQVGEDDGFASCPFIPIEVDLEGGGSVVVAEVQPTGIDIDIDDEARANAAFIVRAVNCHEELVKALSDLTTFADHYDMGDEPMLFGEALENARAILSKARGETP